MVRIWQVCIAGYLCTSAAVRIKKRAHTTTRRADPAAFTEVILTQMHSALVVPVSSYAFAEIAERTPQETSEARIESAAATLNFENQSMSDAAPRGYAAIDWNIPGAETSLLVAPIRFKKEWIRWSLPMHPKCAWGIVGQLGKVYNEGKRQGFATNFVSAAWNALNGGAGENSKLSVIWEGLSSKKDEALFTRLAEAVDWQAIMDCQKVLPQSLQKVLANDIQGRACWNFVIDARNLMCSGWQAEAYTLGCSLRDGYCCEDVMKNFKEYEANPGLWLGRIEKLAHVLGDLWVQGAKEKPSVDVKATLFRQMEILMQEMVAAKVLGHLAATDVKFGIYEGLSNWAAVVHQKGLFDEESDDKHQMSFANTFSVVKSVLGMKVSAEPEKAVRNYTVDNLIDAAFEFFEAQWPDYHGAFMHHLQPNLQILGS